MTAKWVTASPAGKVYEVFARINLEDTLHHIGSVIAPDAELARVYAFTIYQEWAWVEMIVVPRQRIHDSSGVTEYLIFAHKSYQQPLELLGSLRVEREADADQTRLVELAHGQFGREEWIDMIAVPQSAVVQVIPDTQSERISP